MIVCKMLNIASLKDFDSHSKSKKLLSKVKEYFRKKREYMTQRIYQQTGRKFKDLRTMSEFEQVCNQIVTDDDSVRGIRILAKLENKNEEENLPFCREKVISRLIFRSSGF